MQKNTKNIEHITEKAIKCLNEIAQGNAVIGKPIKTEDATIIPLTKISMGFLSGGGEYGQVKVIKESKNFPISAGSGAVVSLKPTGFLVIGKEIKLLKTDNDIYDKFFEKVDDFIGQINEKNKDN